MKYSRVDIFTYSGFWIGLRVRLVKPLFKTKVISLAALASELNVTERAAYGFE